ncbi:MAG: phosphoribosylformylglycinamidine synthase [Clostridia bacterium]
MKINRLYVTKKPAFNAQAKSLFLDIVENLKIQSLKDLKIVHRYDMTGVLEEFYEKAKNTIFSEPNADDCFDETLEIDCDHIIGVKALEGQYDARSAFSEECVKLLNSDLNVSVKYATIYMFYGEMTADEYEKVKKYLINPVESTSCEYNEPFYFNTQAENPEDVEIISDFVNFTDEKIEEFRQNQAFAMSFDDIKTILEYFRDDEKRNPTITELKVIDTYWSDHCRHTTFMTKLSNIKINDEYISNIYEEYLDAREELSSKKDICLMDMAIIGTKYLKKQGILQDLDESDEINACSIKIKVNIDGKDEDYVLMFKNETHNHPTEIEPFGGAATCLGGAIRDPLSGRSYVYQAMRVTGAGDPREAIEDTIAGKLPQRVITKKASQGYSSYGNQIGLATGGVYEIYDQGYKAKRMEVGAVIASAPFSNIVRIKPENGDAILLLGGRTGRDGIGGATGSSKEHNEQSVTKSSSEVQKGNPVTERKIQRLFRNPNATTLIKKCNDFGAGGVCVAIGELADSLEINLDLVPKKYDGLDGTELAISESQERMAVVIAPENVEKFKDLCKIENIEVTHVANVTDTGRLVMKWRGNEIFTVKREFLDTNGAKAETNVIVDKMSTEFFDEKNYTYTSDKNCLVDILSDINVCLKKGLVENFDSTIGAGTVLMPFGGKNMLTEPDGMVAKIPVLKGETTTCSLMTYGYNPNLTKTSTFHGGVYAIIESIAKIVALGGDYRTVRLSLQEYFERMTDDCSWGKPFSAILGAFYAQKHLKIPAIGGKDSMSGTFKDMKVPETIISFAVTSENVSNIISPEFKNTNSKVALINFKRDENNLPNFDDLDKKYSLIYKLIKENKILSAKTVTFGGVGATIAKMSMGNSVGFEFLADVNLKMPLIGAIAVEIADESVLSSIDYILLGKTSEKAEISFKNGEKIAISECIDLFTKPLEQVFKSKIDAFGEVSNVSYDKGTIIVAKNKIAKPKVFIPVFPGSNCEYDTARAFEKAGAEAEIFVFRNLSGQDIEESIEYMAKAIKKAQIIAIPGGFSAGDEPDGSAKFIASVFRNEMIKNATLDTLQDGLMIGICNGFQALIKLGLLPKGEICDITEDMPTLTFNNISRHISCMSKTRICSNKSPWLNGTKIGDIHAVAMSHGEGKFVASEKTLQELILNGQVATQYVDLTNNATLDGEFNPNGSTFAIEGITSADGRILGKMGHSERIGNGLYKNILGETDQKIFESGVKYFK